MASAAASALSLALVLLPVPILYLRHRALAAFESSEQSPAERTVRRLARTHGFGLGVRSHFALDFGFTHLNHGSYGCAPHAVMRAAQKCMLYVEAFPDRFMRRTEEAQAMLVRAADKLSRELLGAPAGSCAFVENATMGVNAVLRSLRLRKGDVVVITDHTYNACKNAVLDVTERAGATLVTHRVELALKRGKGGQGSFEDGLVEAWQATLSKVEGRVAFCLIDHMCVT
jgi:hypothetical protein